MQTGWPLRTDFFLPASLTRPKLPQTIERSSSPQAAAIMYMKRFYLRQSCLDHNPAHLMLTCIYLAGKVTIRQWKGGWLMGGLRGCCLGRRRGASGCCFILPLEPHSSSLSSD